MKFRQCLCVSFVLILTLFINNNIVMATNGVVNGTNINVRSGAGTSYSSLGKVNIPSVYTLLDDNKIAPTDKSSGDCSNWYKISYNNSTGYICSIYLTVSPSTVTGGTGDFDADLKKFPESYRDALKTIHKLYPNARFTALNTGLDWSEVLNNENYIAYGSVKNQARSLIQTQYDGYKSTNSIVYNRKTNTWNTNISGGGSSWFAASTDVVAYYLDPRNFLTYNSVFMFLNHGYSDKIDYNESAINSILSGSFMANHKTNDNTHTFAQAFLDAGRKSGISPYYLAARVIQEIGRSNTRSSYVSGTYNGYYNYYNIDATGSNNLVNALTRAKNEGWDNDYKAIIGGAKFISDGYVSTGQSTLYLEKWDVIDGGNGYFSHQYMQNVQAVVSEANTLYNTYINNNLTTSTMEFLIPVYNNIPDKTSLPNTGNPNNYLSNITINGYSINGFDMDTTTYTYNISKLVDKIELDVTMIAGSSSATGIGTISLKDDLFKNGEYVHKISVKAGNGKIREYKIKFTRDHSKSIPISDIINYNGYVSDGTYISGIEVGSTTDSFIDNLKKSFPNLNVKVTDDAGTIKQGVLATGDKVSISTDNESKTYVVIIYGDLNGDGKITASDYVYVKNNIMGTREFKNFQKISGDINKDNKITASDYVFIKNHIMGTNMIEQ